MNLLFVHGWGFGPDVWSKLASLLPGEEQRRWDRGYFGDANEAPAGEPYVAIAHSFGAMPLLAEPPPGCQGLVAINGFDRFAATDERPGVARRVLDRMIGKLERDPTGVVADFRKRCGCDEPFGTPRLETLRADLIAMRDEDLSAASAHWPHPLLSLQGGTDPILPETLRDTAFVGAPDLSHETHPEGGHLLPLTNPSYCAAAIGRFLERVA